MKPRLVISGVNLTEAGPLSVFKDALSSLVRLYADRYEIVALVHSRSLFELQDVTYLEFPKTKLSWWRRLRFEYWTCRALSEKLRPHLWLAMHDITPNVRARVRAVYCHNASPFYRFTATDAMLDWRFGLFTLFYRFLYKINIRKNAFVVVQQEWLRSEFKQRYQVSSVVVAHPSIEHIAVMDAKVQSHDCTVRRFFFPAYPRIFKNVELILQATRILARRGVCNFEIWLTLAGNENPYAQKLFSAYRDLCEVKWLGLLTRAEVFQRYAEADCLIFPSKLETWGMPISEFRQTGKPMLIADLPYAHETVGEYGAVRFFQPDCPDELAVIMERFMDNDLQMERLEAISIASPFAENWDALFAILLGEVEGGT